MPEYRETPVTLQDRRTDLRYAIEVPALLVWGGERYRGTVRNISSRGALITLEPRAGELREEDPVEMILEELDLHHDATICRVESLTDEEEPVAVALILHDAVDLPSIWARYL